MIKLACFVIDLLILSLIIYHRLPPKKKILGKKIKKKRTWTTFCCEGKMRKLQVGEAKISQKSDKDLWAKVTGGVGEKAMNESSRRGH